MKWKTIVLLTGAFALMLLLENCGTRKVVSQSNLDIKQASSAQLDIHQNLIAETFSFGDTLNGISYFPVDSNQKEPETISGESVGIKYHIKLKPRRNSAGKLAGYDLSFQGIAKPVAKTSIKNETQSSGTKTENTQVALKQEHSDTRKWWSPPAWVYWLIIISGIVAVGLFYKRIINLLKFGK